jgi:hypothetical protein
VTPGEHVDVVPVAPQAVTTLVRVVVHESSEASEQTTQALVAVTVEQGPVVTTVEAAFVTAHPLIVVHVGMAFVAVVIVVFADTVMPNEVVVPHNDAVWVSHEGLSGCEG